MENIYEDAGNEVSIKRYVNRNKIEKLISERVLSNQASGSFSLTGMQRTGKSSILHNMFFREDRKKELLAQKKIVIDNSLASVGSADDIFINMVKGSYRVIKGIEPAEKLEELSEAYEDLKGWSAKRDSLFDMQVYLEEMAALGYQLIVVMDEFDNATTLFEECSHCFNYLREIAYKSKYNTNYVIASRRTLSEISNKATKGVSPFPNIFVNEFVGPYNQEEMQECYDIFKNKYGEDFPEKEKKDMQKYSGGLAFWVDIILKEYVKRMSEGETDISVEKIYKDIEYHFWSQYGKMTELLDEQELLKPLMQFEFGPVMTATREDRSLLCCYGIVNEKKKNEFEIFSKGYKEYLYMQERAIDFAPLWYNTERALRRILERFLRTNYGDKEWLNTLKKKYGDTNIIDFEECQRRLGKTKQMMLHNQVTGAVSEIDMLQTRELFKVIAGEWQTMCKVFPSININTWKELGKSISSTRNDFQHNNYQFLSEGSIAQNNANLTFILECINKWEAKNQKR